VTVVSLLLPTALEVLGDKGLRHRETLTSAGTQMMQSCLLAEVLDKGFNSSASGDV
jgi:hypothetical protein